MTELFDSIWRLLTEVDKWKLLGSASLTFLTVMLIRSMLRKRTVMCRLKKKQKQLEEARSRLQDRVKTYPPLSHFKELDGLQVQQRLQANEMTPLEALRLYQKRVVDVLGSNCICEIIEEAESVAMSVSADIVSPIRGLPVSIKECIEVAGYDSPVGLVSGVLDPAKEDSVLIKVLRKVGAVPFVTTTMSPTGFCLDASTEIYGKQRNPLDAKRLAGGSSSGEATLLAKGGSPLGFGTDIAGSLRIPAAFCGICSLKPTTYRVSTIGLKSASEDGCVSMRAVLGPMSKNTSLLADAMKAILCSAMFELDCRVPELPFNDEIYSGTKPLVIGYYTCMGEELAVKPVAAVESAMHKVISLLQSKGHKVVKFNVPDSDKLIRLSTTAMFANGGASLLRATQYDPTNSRLRLLCLILSVPVFIRRSVAWLFNRMISKPIGSTIRSSTGCQSTQEVLCLLSEIGDYQLEFARAWSEAKLDVLICPAMPFPAPLDSSPDTLICGLTNYTLPFNVLDYPAGVLPVSKVSAADVKASRDAEQQYRREGDWLNAKLSSLQKDTEGLPIGLQVVGKPLCEEMVLRVMREVEQGVSEA